MKGATATLLAFGLSGARFFTISPLVLWGALTPLRNSPLYPLSLYIGLYIYIYVCVFSFVLPLFFSSLHCSSTPLYRHIYYYYYYLL